MLSFHSLLTLIYLSSLIKKNLKGEINGGIMETQMSRTITPVQVRLNRVMQGFR